MYGWLWRRLPGNWVAKSFGCLLLFAGVVALLFLFVFPWVEPRLPFNDVTVDSTGTPTPTSSASPSP